MGLRGRGARPKAPRSLKGTPGHLSWSKGSRPERVIKFLESLPVTKGHLAGRRMKLLPDQREFIRTVYGRLDGNAGVTSPHGRRIIRLAVKSAPRGNGKSGLLAGLSLCHLCGPEAVDRGEVYSAAIDRGQAAILFNEMRAIIQAMPELEARTNIVKHFKKIEVLSGKGTGSVYEALSNDARRGHGLAPSFWCYDELGQVRDRELLDALQTAMGKQPEALGIVISTQAPDDEHPLSQLIDIGLSGVDPSLYVQLHAAPDDADPFDEAVWKACNPAYGIFLDAGDFQRQAARARRIPAFLSAFRNLRLNQRVNADQRLIAQADWSACAGDIDVEALDGRACWGALDLSSTTDLTALVLVFEAPAQLARKIAESENDGAPSEVRSLRAPADPGKITRDSSEGLVTHGSQVEPMPVRAWFWLPAGCISEREDEDRTPYRLWRDHGYIETPAGRAIDRRAIALRLAEIASRYQLRALAFDEWRFADLEVILNQEGIVLPLKKMRQGFKSMGPCVDALESAILDRRIVHDRNPVLTMCIANAVATMDPAGNRKIDKARSRSRVDGAVCLAMALGTRAQEPPPQEYDFSQPMMLTIPSRGTV